MVWATDATDVDDEGGLIEGGRREVVGAERAGPVVGGAIFGAKGMKVSLP